MFSLSIFQQIFQNDTKTTDKRYEDNSTVNIMLSASEQ